MRVSTSENANGARRSERLTFRTSSVWRRERPGALVGNPVFYLPGPSGTGPIGYRANPVMDSSATGSASPCREVLYRSDPPALLAGPIGR
jgi:hypothetical protein